VNALANTGDNSTLYINQIIYTEVSIAFNKIEELESALNEGGFQMLEMPKEALFLAGKAYLNYRRNKGTKKAPLPDFYIGAQAAVLGMDLITQIQYLFSYGQTNLSGVMTRGHCRTFFWC
jgi:predicted nucleic acid-binding protein